MLKLRRNLRDSFAMALEEMENVVGGEIVGQTDEEIKILEEEAVKQGVEIQQDLAAVEECCADIETLQEQLGENDKKLTDPDIVVTAVDVEISEECYKGMAFKYGIRDANAIRFSHESVLDAVKAEPRRYLAMSNEGIKEFIIKIWEKIKAFFRKIGEKLGLIDKVEAVKSKQAEEKLEETKKEIEKMPDAIKNKKIKVLKPKKPNKKKVSKESYKYGVSLEEVDDDDIFARAETVGLPLTAAVLGDKAAFDEMTNGKRIIGMCRASTKLLSAVQSKLADGADVKSSGIQEAGVKIYHNIDNITKRTKLLCLKFEKYFDSDNSRIDPKILRESGVISVSGLSVYILTNEEIDTTEAASVASRSYSTGEFNCDKLFISSNNFDNLCNDVEPKEKISPKMILEYANILSKTKYETYRNDYRGLLKDIDDIVSDAHVNFSPSSDVATNIRCIASILKTFLEVCKAVPNNNRRLAGYFDMLIKYANENGIDLD